MCTPAPPREADCTAGVLVYGTDGTLRARLHVDTSAGRKPRDLVLLDDGHPFVTTTSRGIVICESKRAAWELDGAARRRCAIDVDRRVLLLDDDYGTSVLRVSVRELVSAACGCELR